MATATEKMQTNLPFMRIAFFLFTISASASAQTMALGGSQAYTTLAQGWAIKPRVSLSETWTDNVRLDGTKNTGQQDWITQISPGVRITGNSARVKAYFDYQLNSQFYLRSDYSRTQNALSSFANMEAINNWLFFDASARIAQQSISAFGTQSPNSASINANSTETAVFKISPFIRGQLLGSTRYTLRYEQTVSRSNSETVSDVDSTLWSGQIQGDTVFSPLLWSLNANQQSVDYSLGRKTESSRLFGRLTYAFNPQFRIIGSTGWEQDNYLSTDKQSRITSGYGFDWSITDRTQFSAFKEQRSFGDGHRVLLSHRFPLSSIRYTDTRDVSVLPNQFATVGLGSIYDLYFEQYESLIPDPISRAAFVNALLARSGIDPNAQATSSFLASRATIRRSQQLALTLQGIRNSITLIANRNQSESTLSTTPLNDDFSQTNLISQRGFSVNYLHRLSEISSMSATYSHQESTGGGNNALKTILDLMQVNLTTRLGAKTNASLSFRRTHSEGSNSFTENAVVGTVSYIY